MPPRTATAPKTAQNGQGVIMAKPDIKITTIPIVGLSPLICHAWSAKAIKMMLDKQTKQAKTGRAAKDPEQDYKDSLYNLPEGGYGFPASAFKKAAVRAGTYTDDKMTYLRGAFYVQGDMVTIDGTPQPREDMVRVGMGTADIRYRAEFPDWSADLRVEYNARAISLDQVANLFSVAGFSVGVGDWRPEKDGSYGRFAVRGGMA
jgi:hypothetical protein